eukprot:931707-Rhodomonas_salina.1
MCGLCGRSGLCRLCGLCGRSGLCELCGLCRAAGDKQLHERLFRGVQGARQPQARVLARLHEARDLVVATRAARAHQ